MFVKQNTDNAPSAEENAQRIIEKRYTYDALEDEKDAAVNCRTVTTDTTRIMVLGIKKLG